ncbi:hypothetical protein C8R44DRAFT_890585 [Mycena epipterygia]|nr:hypothetical protein C8R44DRAFT_890585 [Mycena epipterygia]
MRDDQPCSVARIPDVAYSYALVDVAQAGFVIHVNFTRKKTDSNATASKLVTRQGRTIPSPQRGAHLAPEPRVAAAANSSSGHHHHLPTLHGLGHSTVRHSPSSDTTSSHSQDSANSQDADASTLHADWTPDAGPAFHAAFYAQVWCTYRTGSSASAISRAECAARGGGTPAWVEVDATTGGQGHAGESGSNEPPGMSHSPPQSNSSYSPPLHLHSILTPHTSSPPPAPRAPSPLLLRHSLFFVLFPFLPLHSRHSDNPLLPSFLHHPLHASVSSAGHSASAHSHSTSTSTTSSGGTKKKWWPPRTKGWTSDAGWDSFFWARMRVPSTPLLSCAGADFRVSCFWEPRLALLDFRARFSNFWRAAFRGELMNRVALRRAPALASLDAVDVEPFPVPPPTPADHARLLYWFLDAPGAPFGVHRMAPAGRPMLVDAFPACGLGVSVVTDGTFYQTEPALDLLGPPADVLGALVGREEREEGRWKEKDGKGWGDRPVLLLLGIRLGLDGVNPAYHETIKVRLIRLFDSLYTLHLRVPSSSVFHVPPVLPFGHPRPTSATPFSSSLLRCVALTLHFLAFSFSPSRTVLTPPHSYSTPSRSRSASRASRPSSYYFVGAQGGGLFYLDPHNSRPAVPLRPFVPSLHSHAPRQHPHAHAAQFPSPDARRAGRETYTHGGSVSPECAEGR